MSAKQDTKAHTRRRATCVSGFRVAGESRSFYAECCVAVGARTLRILHTTAHTAPTLLHSMLLHAALLHTACWTHTPIDVSSSQLACSGECNLPRVAKRIMGQYY